MQSVLRARLESALGERIPSPFTDLDSRVCESVPTGIAQLDALTGGLPRGAITEIFGPPSSGSTSAMVSILAEATARDEVCALVDGTDTFDPKSAAEAGIQLDRLLWIRCRKLDQVLKTTDLLLQGGGFGRVVMDAEGLERLFGSYAEIASKVSAAVSARGIEANVALASNIDAAVCAARGFGGITILQHGTEARRLSDLPLAVLSPSPEILETLERWGIRTLGAF